MEMIDRIIEQEQVFNPQELTTTTERLRSEIASFSRQLDRLGKLETFLVEKYTKKLADLVGQLNKNEEDRSELRILIKEFRKDKETRSTFNKKIVDLEKDKKVIQDSIKQIVGYKKTSDEQVTILKTEREALYLRVQDLFQMLDLAEKAELNEKELDTVCQRVSARKELLEEVEVALRKRTIDLLFEGYMLPRSKSAKSGFARFLSR